MKKLALICSSILFLVQACAGEPVQNLALPIETAAAAPVATATTSPFPDLFVNNGIQYLADKLTLVSQDGSQALVDNRQGEAGLEWYQFMNTFFNPREPLRLRLNFHNENNRTGFILIAGQLRDSQGGPEWWRGVHELYITPYPDHVNFNFHDGRSENSNAGVDVYRIREDEPFYLIFSDPQGNAFEVWDGRGNLVESIALSELDALDFSGGFFTEGRYYLGVALENGAALDVREFSILTESPLIQPAETELPGWLQEARWIYLGGPRGGTGYDIRIHPENHDIIWVTDANAGVQKSENGGVTWHATNEGIDARWGPSTDAIPIFTLAVSPFDPDVVWAGAMNTLGLYKSVDGGKTWLPKEEGIVVRDAMEFRGIAFDPYDPNVLYCAGNYAADWYTFAQKGFIYKSVDGGEHWTLLRETGAVVRWIVIDPTDTDIIYISTGIFDRRAVEAEGILKSTDGGRTWARMNNGLFPLAVNALVMDPDDPQTLLAGTGGQTLFWSDDPNDQHGGLFITHNGGETWRKIDPMPQDEWYVPYSAIAYAPSDPNIIYADAGNFFLSSTDRGETWKRIDVSPDPDKGISELRGKPIALAVHPQDPDIIYMNAYAGGVFLSTDGGLTWSDSSTGYSGAGVFSVEIDPNDPARIFTGDRNGIHESQDGGTHWVGRNSMDAIMVYTALGISPVDPKVVLAGAFITGQILRSSDGGMHWFEVMPPIGVDTFTGRRNIYDLAFAPDGNLVYAATGYNIFDGSFEEGVIGSGFFKSENGGVSWRPVASGLEGTTMTFFDVEIDPLDPDVLYLATMDNGVYKSMDGGETWFASSEGMGSKRIKSVQVDPQNTNIIYAGAQQGGVWKSEDGGMTWLNSSNGLPASADITTIAINPNDPLNLFVSDQFSGVYVTVDGGETWQEFNAGLEMRTVQKLVISNDGLHLYAATNGRGVFRLDLNGLAPAQ